MQLPPDSITGGISSGPVFPEKPSNGKKTSPPAQMAIEPSQPSTETAPPPDIGRLALRGSSLEAVYNLPESPAARAALAALAVSRGK